MKHPPLLHYQHPHSAQTLQQGLDEYFAAHADLLQGRDLSSPAAQAFFRCHDTVHVVYGCGICLQDEAVVKIASIFGTTEGFAVLKGYALYESRQIYRGLGMADILRGLGPALLAVPRTWMRCTAQTQRWPWDKHAQHLHTPLAALRAHYGIVVA